MVWPTACSASVSEVGAALAAAAGSIGMIGAAQ